MNTFNCLLAIRYIVSDSGIKSDKEKMSDLSVGTLQTLLYIAMQVGNHMQKADPAISGQ